MLEPHLAEIKHQIESKLQHTELLACRKLFLPHYTEKAGGLSPPPATTVVTAIAGSKLAWETFGRPNKIQRKMKKIYTQLQTPTKQR
jgi:hypothetical protein